jgi:hypothetical protein
MTPKEIENERLKLSALYLNGMAVALITAGVFGPIISYTLGIIPSAKPYLVFLFSAGCFLFSAIIHYAARVILGDLQ